MEKSCVKTGRKSLTRFHSLIDAMNLEVLGYLGIKFKSVKRTQLTMSLNYLRCTKKQLDWMKLLSFPDVVIEKAFDKNNTEELYEYLERLKPMHIVSRPVEKKEKQLFQNRS